MNWILEKSDDEFELSAEHLKNLKEVITPYLLKYSTKYSWIAQFLIDLKLD